MPDFLSNRKKRALIMLHVAFLACGIVMGTAFFANAAVLQSYSGSSVAYQLVGTGASGYPTILYTSPGVTVKAIFWDQDFECNFNGVAIAAVGPGIFANSDAATPASDGNGHTGCLYTFNGSSGYSLSAGTYHFLLGYNNGATSNWWGGLDAGVNTGHGNLSASTFNASTFEQAYAICDDASGCTIGPAPPTDTTTHFDTVTPAGNATIATSSAATFGATGYINAADYQSGMYIQLKYAPYASMQASVANPDALFTTIRFPISSAGSFTVSTTSPTLTVGKYTMQTDIRSASWLNNALNFFGFGQFAGYGIKTATSTVFTAAHLSGYDVFVASTTASVETYLASSTVSLAACSAWTSFNLGDCLNLLFVPQTQPIVDALGNFKNGFLQYAPWGYLTRVIVILSGTATSSLPAFSTTIQLGSPNDTDTFTFDMQDMITGGATLLNSIPANGSAMSVQDIIEPLIQLFIALFVIIIIIRDLTGAGRHGSHNFGHNNRE